MGGTISLGFRFKDKDDKIKNLFMFHWTNDLPERFLSKSFISQGDDFYKLIDESDEHHPEYHSSYARRTSSLQESEYGFVLVDFVNRKCLANNHYFRPFRKCFFNGASLGGDEDFVAQLKELSEIDWLDVYQQDGIESMNKNDFLNGLEKSGFMCVVKLKPEIFEVEHYNSFETDVDWQKATDWMKAHGW